MLNPNCGFCGYRFGRKGLTRHESACGRDLSNRYRILAVSGWEISPSFHSVGGRKAGDTGPTSYVILDSYDLLARGRAGQPRRDGAAWQRGSRPRRSVAS